MATISFGKIQGIVLILLSIFFNSCSPKDTVLKNPHHEIDSTGYFINQSKVDVFSISDRLEKLNEAYRINALLGNDSLKNRNLLKIAYQAKKLEDTSFLRKQIRKLLGYLND